METFKYIFGGIIVATTYFFIIRYFVEQNDSYKIDRKIIDKALMMSQLHIIFIFIAIGLTNSLNPFAETDLVNSILDDTFLGKIYDFFSDERPAPDPGVVALVDHIKQNQNVFVFVGLLFSAIESLGLITRCINRWIIEITSIVTSICTLLYLNSLSDTVQKILSTSMMESLAGKFGLSLTSSLSWIGTMSTIIFIVLVIDHIFNHNALNKYYAPINTGKPNLGFIGAISAGGVLFITLFYKYIIPSDIDENDTEKVTENNITSVESEKEISDEKEKVIKEEVNSVKDEISAEDYDMIKESMESWNYIHNTNNYASSAAMEQLYTSTVKFYGQAVTAKECVDLFYRTLKKYDSFSQKIKGEVSFTKLSDGSVRCDFVKEVQTDGACKDYEAYLVFKKEDNWWYISEESDKITDAYFEKRKVKNSTYFDEIKSNPNNHVMTVYSTENSWVYYCNDNDGNILYRRNLGTGETDRLASLDQDFMIYLVDTFYVKDNRYLDIKGNNMSNSNMNRDIVCRIDMETGKSRELLMGRVISRKDNQYIVSQETVIPTGKSSADGDYFFYDQYYDLDGVLIDGKTMYGEGHLGKQPFAMQMYSSKDGMTGWCQYIGNTNFMTFKGNLTSDKSFEVEIYNQSNVHCGSFLGNVDFERQQIDGIFRSLDGKDFDLFIAGE